MFAYQGSKRGEIVHIMPYVPQVPTLADVFGGGGSVYLALRRARPDATVIYNDFDIGVYNIFKSVAEGKAAQVEAEVSAMLAEHLARPDFEALKLRRNALIDLIDRDETNKTAVNMLYLQRTSLRGLWNCRNMVNLRKIVQLKITSFNATVNQPDCVRNMDYRDIMRVYQADAGAFLYLDPPYNSKNTSTATYRRMAGGYHNYLVFIQEFMNDPATLCKVMLNVDFTGDVYCRFKDRIKVVYPVRYSASNTLGDLSKPPLYHVIICNF